jgi:hypothetical protein
MTAAQSKAVRQKTNPKDSNVPKTANHPSGRNSGAGQRMKADQGKVAGQKNRSESRLNAEFSLTPCRIVGNEQFKPAVVAQLQSSPSPSAGLLAEP